MISLQVGDIIVFICCSCLYRFVLVIVQFLADGVTIVELINTTHTAHHTAISVCVCVCVCVCVTLW